MASSIPNWVWIAGLIGALIVPWLIHLIQVFRYQTVRFAAIDFLLQSSRKKQHSIRLSQAALIGTRILLLLSAVFLFIQPGCDGETANTNEDVLHIVIIDDSYSMQQPLRHPVLSSSTQLAGDASCFTAAKYVARQLADQVKETGSGRWLMLKTSALGNSNSISDSVPVDSELPNRVDSQLSRIEITDQANRTGQLLDQLEILLADQATKKIYLLSDFRAKDWAAAENEWLESLMRQESIELVHCVDSSEVKNVFNVQVLDCQFTHSVVAKGLPCTLKVTVKNTGSEIVDECRLQLHKSRRLDEASRQMHPSFHTTAELPTSIKQLKPSEIRSITIPIVFPETGEYFIEINLPDDDLNADNFFSMNVNVNQRQSVLILTDSQRMDSRFLTLLLQPGSPSQPVDSGMEVRVENINSASNINIPANTFALFWASDQIPDTKLRKRLNDYVQDGGLLFLLPGERASAESWNQSLFTTEFGLMPFPLHVIVDVPVDDSVADIRMVDSGLQELFRGPRKPILEQVSVWRKWIPPRDNSWQENMVSVPDVLANVGGLAETPLLAAKKWGKGNVIMSAVPLSNQWHNWTTHPTFMIVLYRLLQRYGRIEQTPTMTLNSKSFRTESRRIENGQRFRFANPNQNGNQTIESNSDTNIFTSAGHWLAALKDDPSQIRSGNSKMFSVVVDPEEANLETVQSIPMRERLTSWNQFSLVDESGQSHQTHWVLLILAVLFAESFLSFHLTQRGYL